MEALSQAADCLRILAHPVRLRIVQLLLHGRYTVGEIATDCEVP
ncbi:MAG: ArsR family transcriptional regulator, partial [Planctomycetales bacterium]|nr:ArsR family transcriptional regulator [Planctomycetales bacterium]